ncbi:MAG: hypothetical protein P8Z75_13530 [Gammaproteobacteria bacterium]
MPDNADNKVRIFKEKSGLSAARIVVKYLHHLRSITVIRQLLSLITVVQQHRGANLALLEGDDTFSGKVSALQNEINNRFTTLQLLNRELSTPIPDPEIATLLQEWRTLRDWAGGSALENFNLHSNFIEQLMKLMWQVTEKTDSFQLAAAQAPANNDITSSPAGGSFADDTLLVQFILLETPEFMELLARLRGLATHACVMGACDPEHGTWLDYLLKQLNLKKERFRVLSKSLQKYSLRDVPALIDLQIQDVRIVQLIQLVENKILRQDTIELDSHHIFSMATNIINAQMEVVRQGLDFIQNKIHRQLDGWYAESTVSS